MSELFYIDVENRKGRWVLFEDLQLYVDETCHAIDPDIPRFGGPNKQLLKTLDVLLADLPYSGSRDVFERFMVKFEKLAIAENRSIILELMPHDELVEWARQNGYRQIQHDDRIQSSYLKVHQPAE
jgi:hypothetical protein